MTKKFDKIRQLVIDGKRELAASEAMVLCNKYIKKGGNAKALLTELNEYLGATVFDAMLSINSCLFTL